MTRYEAQGFEKFWNSTFGIPQQVIYRTIRAMQNPNVDLLSEQGLLDSSLIPIFGFFDDDRNDVSAEEMVRRTGKLLGTKLDPNSMANQLGIGIFTDPTTFLTGGLTALGRGGAAAVKAANVGGVKQRLLRSGIDMTDLMSGKGSKITKKTFLNHIDKTLSEGKNLKSLSRFRLRQAKKHLADLDFKYMNDIFANAGKSELRLGLPILHRYGANIYKSDSHKWWLKLMASEVGKTSAGKAIATTAAPIANLPFIKGGLQRMSTLGSGMKLGRVADNIYKTTTLSEKQVERIGTVLTPAGQKIKEGVSTLTPAVARNTFQSLVDGGLDPRRAFLKTILSAGGNASSVRVPKNEAALEDMFQRFYKSFFNLADDIKVDKAVWTKNLDGFGTAIGSQLSKFKGRYQRAMEKFHESFITREVNPAVDKATKDAREKGILSWWKKGKQINNAWAKIWKHGTDFKSLDEANKLLVKLEAQTTSELREVGKRLSDLLGQDAKALGIEADQLDNMLLHAAQGQPRLEEIAEWVNKLNLSDAGATEAGVVLDNFVNRLLSLVQQNGVYVRDGKSNPLLAELMEHVSNQFGNIDGLSPLEFKAFFGDQKAWIPKVSARESIGGDARNKIIVSLKGNTKLRHKGRYLGELEDAELDEVLDDLLGAQVIKRKIQGTALQKALRAVPELRKLQKELKLNDREMYDVLKRAEKKSVVLVSKRVGNKKVSKKLTDDQRLRLNDVVTKGEYDFSLKPRLSDLSEGRRKLYNAVNTIKKLRKAGQEEIRVPLPRPMEPLPARVPESVGARVIETGKDVELNDMGLATAKLWAVAKELQRGSKGKAVDPALLNMIEESLTDISRAWDTSMREVLGDNTKFLDEIQNIQRQSFIRAVEQGAHTLSSPLAYVGRVFTKAQSRALDGILSDKQVQGAISATALPTMGATFARSADNMTLEEMNEIYHEVQKGSSAQRAAAKPFTDFVEQVAKEAGIDLDERFSESIYMATLGRAIQAGHTAGNVNYATSAIDALTKSSQGIAGQIVGKIIHGERINFGTTQKLGKAKVEQTKTTAKQTDVKYEGIQSGFIVKDKDGYEHLVQSEMMNGSMGTAGILLGDQYADTATALGVRATRGPLDPSEGIASLGPLNAERLANQHVIIGDKATVNGIFNSMQSTWSNSKEHWILYDQLNYTIKKWQTVFRPAFWEANLMSMASQLTVIGSKPHEIVGGLWDALRFLGGNAEAVKAYSRFTIHDSANKGKKLMGFLPRSQSNVNLDFLDIVRGEGIDKILALSPEEVIKKYPHLKPEDLVFHADGATYSLDEMLEVWRETNMFGTFTSEGLRRGTSNTRTMLELRASGTEDYAKSKLSVIGGGLKKTGEGLAKIAEGTEVTARLTGFFAQLRAGKSLSQAAENVKIATIDYNNLTKAERHGIKRVIPYYTFARHFIPAAGNYFLEHQDRMTRNAHFIMNGPFREERGRLKLDFEAFGEELEMDATRILPHLEALKVMETVGEVFLGTGAMFSDQAEIVNWKENLKQETPIPFTVGSPISAVHAWLDGDEKTSFTKELVDAFWLSRFVWDDPRKDQDEETTTFAKIRQLVIPAGSREREREKAMLDRKLREFSGNLENRLQDALAEDDIEEAAYIQEQYGFMIDYARRLNEEIKK